MKPSRRSVLKQIMLAASAAVLVTPFSARFSGNSFSPTAGGAFAQGNGNAGGGNGGSNSGGNSGNGGGNSGNSGNGGGNSGTGGGNSGGTGRGSSGTAGKASSRASAGRVGLTVTHSNGMSETIRKGRYEMRDAQGRVIVNRSATLIDYLRLRPAG